MSLKVPPRIIDVHLNFPVIFLICVCLSDSRNLWRSSFLFYYFFKERENNKREEREKNLDKREEIATREKKLRESREKLERKEGKLSK